MFRGLCEGSSFDKMYKPITGMNNLMYVGVSGTFIKYDNNQHAWTVSNKLNLAQAQIKASKESYLFGVSSWETLSDQSCESKIFDVSFSSCSRNEFTCADGYCVSLAQRCDHVSDCGDGHDEVNCNILRHKIGYNKHLVPQNSLSSPQSSRDNRLQLNASVSIISIFDINEATNELKVQMSISLSWFDSALNFTNLHNETSHNLLTFNETDSIWRPRLNFRDINTYYHEYNEEESVVIQKTQSLYTTFGLDQGSNERVYSGEINALVQGRIDRSVI